MTTREGQFVNNSYTDDHEMRDLGKVWFTYFLSTGDDLYSLMQSGEIFCFFKFFIRIILS
jgi:hypothetical protein